MTNIMPFGSRQRALNELDFMDIYVRLDADARAHYRAGRGGDIELPDADLPLDFTDDAAHLAAHLRQHFTGVEMGLHYDGMRLRAARLETANGEVWAALRRLPEHPFELEGLGFIEQLPPLLQGLGQRSGLILICGASGQGKTTTATSLLARWLDIHGGIGFTLEDPVEYDMEGRWGRNGYCYQAEIKAEREWGEMLKRALRWHPRYILVGEIRTPDAANQLLRAATSGHTVLATMHAGSMEEALEGLLQLAEQDLGGRAATLLAAGLVGVVHQSFLPDGLHAQFMVTEADNPGSPIRAMIRDRRIGMTRTIADQQMARLVQGGKLF
ncbi:MAG: Flp pilus assembly complex ATPase component TadA [Alphaproteobacteria bacterium]|nr:Flp pilus assembly complex ATPase component TadA [Alphaproteobacteria bacterium]